MTQKLNQVLAIERQVKGRIQKKITAQHHFNKKPALFGGFSKHFKPLDSDGETFPSESQIVQQRVVDSLKACSRSLTELFDVVATKDVANQSAKADVIVDGNTILKDIPATTLIFLEKQLNDIQTFVSCLPILDPAHNWKFDDSSGVYKAEPQTTHKTRKLQKPIVMYDATPEHPAQTQLISEDVVIGHWTTVKQSGALPRGDRESILERIENLAKAVKFAREVANSGEAKNKEIGSSVFDYLFG